ncbi:hypothetical protein [Soonwooa sp.]|uniref:hypothetical protein n=1 Tax=Soonwooa sp. TaxID=1938592 RepID=UPI00260C59E5|nr:hypothetical protein [Soonwooa sp.]
MIKLFKRRTIALSASFAIVSMLVLSCRSSDDGGSTTNGSNYKITVTLNNVSAEDFVSVVTVGAGKSDVYTNWKVNGKVRSGESTISLGKNDFTGSTKTYVIETSEPITTMTAGAQIINYGADLPMSYKIEKNGKTVVDENLTLKGDGTDFSKNYSF